MAFNCEFCPKSFSKKTNKARHVMDIHQNSGRFKCKNCDKQFSHESRLKRHETVHMTEKPLACEVCQRRFTNKYNLKIHHLNIHSKKEQMVSEMLAIMPVDDDANVHEDVHALNNWTESNKLTLEQTLRSLINNPERSDCVFLVGERRIRIYAHKFVLALTNPIFHSIFFKELVESKFEIEIPDLHEKGFLNLIRTRSLILHSYLYTDLVPKFDLSEIYWTVTAANRYLASEFTKRLLNIVSDRLEPDNSCLIYDQLLKLELNDDVKSLIRKTETMIKTEVEVFNETKIDQHTLESILRFDHLYADEYTVLSACLKWTDAELERRGLEATVENKRSLFAGLKHLVRFDDLKTDELFRLNINAYLPFDETISVLDHSNNKSKPLKIDYRSPRGPFKC